MSVGRTRLGKPQPESMILFASLACACSPRSSLFRWRGPPSQNVHLPGGLMFSVQVAWSTFTWLGGRSWRLHLHPPSTRLDYSIGAQSFSRGLNLKQIFTGDFFYRLLFFTGDLVGIKSKCCGEGRSAYWICGGGTTSSNLTDTTRIDWNSLQSPGCHNQ